MGRYIIAREAEQDIDEILTYIAADNLEGALLFYDRLTNLFEMLADNSNAGVERPELKEDLRSFPQGSYLIFYRRWAGDIAIVRVLHGARDLEDIFT